MKIRDAINALEEKGLIKTIRDGNTWTLTLAKKAERDRNVIRIRRDWVIAVKTCKGNGLDWSAALKVSCDSSGAIGFHDVCKVFALSSTVRAAR